MEKIFYKLKKELQTERSFRKKKIFKKFVEMAKQVDKLVNVIINK